MAVANSLVFRGGATTMAAGKSRKALEDLSERFSRESAGSIDYGANAKAIALQAENLRKAIIELMDAGYRLTGVEPVKGYGASPDNYVLMLSFRKSDTTSPIDLDEKTLYATIDLAARNVFRIDTDAAQALGRMAADVPFVLAVPSRAGTVTIAQPGARQREAVFLDQLGIVDLLRAAHGNGWLAAADNTAWDTYITTATGATEYESPVNSGVNPDTVTDTKQDSIDYDTKIDTKNDPDNGSWIDLPTDRPVIVLPRPSGPGPGPGPTPGPDPLPPWRRGRP